ncbi:hypothetical protein BD311DRAFT_788220, partial [Dichomitus squalens]
LPPLILSSSIAHSPQPSRTLALRSRYLRPSTFFAPTPSDTRLAFVSCEPQDTPYPVLGNTLWLRIHAAQL